VHYPRSGGARAAAVVAANATFPAVLLVVGGYPDPDPDDRPDLGAACDQAGTGSGLSISVAAVALTGNRVTRVAQELCFV